VPSNDVTFRLTPPTDFEIEAQQKIDAVNAGNIPYPELLAEQNFQDAQALNYGTGVEAPINPYKISNADGTEVAERVQDIGTAIPTAIAASAGNMNSGVEASSAPPMPGEAFESIGGDTAPPAQQLLGVAAPVQQQSAGMNQLLGGLKASADADSNAAAAIVAENDKKAAALAESEQRQQELKKDFDARIKSQTADYEKKAAEYADVAKAKIDPNGFWNNSDGAPDTGRKIGAAIAIALSGIGATLQGPGAQNQALGIINSAIDRDIDAQKTNLANKRQVASESAAMSKNMLSEFRQQFGDETSAELATRAVLLQKADIQMQNIAAKTGGAKAQANYQIASGQLKQQQDAIKTQLAQHQSQVELSKAIVDAKAAGKAIDPSLLLRLPKETQAFISDMEKKAVPNWNGKTAYAANADLAKDFVKYKDEVQPAIDSTNRLLELTGKANRLSPKDRAAAEMEVQALVGALRLPFTGPGILNIEERKVLEGLIGNPTKLFSYTPLEQAKLLNIKHKLNSDMNGRAKNAGLEVAPPASSRLSTFISK